MTASGKVDIVCRAVDYADEEQGELLVTLLDGYARDPFGGGTPLPDSVRETLPSRLARIPTAFSFLAYVDGRPAGLINCFEGFSTFAARPLVNVHDLFVLEEFRGNGVSQALLRAAEEEATGRGCCKLTLECLSRNQAALNAYKKVGFAGYELNPEHGVALFMEKKLKNVAMVE
jgi:GNAT superfamily N-acetyltransferase